MVKKRGSQYKAYEKFIFAKLRQIFTWTVQKSALAKGKSGVNKYPCAVCKEIFTRADIHVDHITTVMPLTGWDGKWTEYIQRQFEGETQLLCQEHHKEKTKKEAGIRAKYRRAKKEQK